MSDRMRGRTRWTLTDARALARLLGLSFEELVLGPEREDGAA